MGERRIVRADIFFCGALAAAIIGSVSRVGVSGTAQITWLAVVLIAAPMSGTMAAILISGRLVTPVPFLWTLVGGVGATFIGLSSFFILYDMLLMVFAAIATAVFLGLIARAVRNDDRSWARALRLLVVSATAALVVAPWLTLGDGPATQAAAAVLLATWPLAGAALLAPVTWRLEPMLPDESSPAEDQLA